MRFEFLDANYDPCPPHHQPTLFGFECPTRPGFMCTGLVIRGNPDGCIPPNRTWAWNGDREKPTFSPSINCKGCSHGFITDGVWRNA